MFYKNIRRYFRHHITEQTAAHTGDGSHKYEEKGIIRKSLTDPGVHPYYRKNPKSNGIHDQHYFVISDIPFQQFPLEIEKEKYQHRSHHRYCCINRLLKYSRRDDSKGHITDHTAAHCCDHTQYTNPENIHLLFRSHQCP